MIFEHRGHSIRLGGQGKKIKATVQFVVEMDTEDNADVALKKAKAFVDQVAQVQERHAKTEKVEQPVNA